MKAVEAAKRHWVFPVVTLIVTVTGITYAVINAVHIAPMQDNLAQKKDQIEELQKRLAAASSFTGQSQASGQELETLRGQLAQRDQQIRELRVHLGADTVADTPTGTASLASVTTRRTDNYLIELQQCRPLGRDLRCRFRVTNETQDRQLNFHVPNSMVVDHHGNEYKGSQGRIGKNEGSWLSIKLIAGIAYEAEVVFPGVPPELNTLAALEFDFANFQTQFNNVPIGS
jgi:hypothetical protein